MARSNPNIPVINSPDHPVTPPVQKFPFVDINTGNLTVPSFTMLQQWYALLIGQALNQWIPELSFGGGTTGILYDTRLATWHQIGNSLICRFTIILTNKGTDVGNAIISGLPFPPNTDPTNIGSVGLVASYFMAGLVGQIVTQFIDLSELQLRQSSPTGLVPVTDANFTNTSQIFGSIQYVV